MAYLLSVSGIYSVYPRVRSYCSKSVTKLSFHPVNRLDLKFDSLKSMTIDCFSPILVMWVYVHLALAPGWISDATVYRKRPVTKNGCLINESAQPVWHIFTQLLIFDLPEITMVLAFPIIHFTRLLRRRKTLLPVNDDILPVAGSQGTEQTGASNRRRSSALRGTQVAPPGVAGSGFNQALSKYRNSLGVPPTGQGFGRDRRARLFHSKGYVVLMLLTVSVTVCWTPIAMFYNLITFMTFGSPMLYEVGTMLFMCQTMLDPIIFTLALKKLRRALREFIPFGWGAFSFGLLLNIFQQKNLRWFESTELAW